MMHGQKNIKFGLHVKWTAFWSDLNQVSIVSQDLKKTLHSQTSRKIRLVTADIIHADRRTDITHLIVPFSELFKST